MTQAVEASEAAAEEAAEDPVDEPKKVEPKTEDQSPTSPADQPVTREEHQTAEAVEAVLPAPAQEAEPEPKAAATSENLSLDEIADREGLPSSRQLEEDPSEERSRRRRRRRRKRRCEKSEKTQSEGKKEPTTELVGRGRSPVPPGVEVPQEPPPPRPKRWASQGSESDAASSVATGRTSVYDTDRGSVTLTPRRDAEEKVDKSYVALPPEESRPRQRTPASSARPDGRRQRYKQQCTPCCPWIGRGPLARDAGCGEVKSTNPTAAAEGCGTRKW